MPKFDYRIVPFIHQKFRNFVNNVRKSDQNKTIPEKDVINYVLERFSETKKSNNINELIKFHTINKYLLMAHSQKYLRVLGNTVANHEKKSISQIFEDYEKILSITLFLQPTIKSNINVLMHIFGSFSKFFNNAEKDAYMNLLALYRKEKKSLGETISEIEPLIYRFNNTYLASQSYFLLYSDIKKGHLFSFLSKIKS